MILMYFQAKYLNPSYYEDIVEERSIGLTCGFPLCSNQIAHKFSQSQKFHISMRYKKVFDVTERKVKYFTFKELSNKPLVHIFI
jgi:hypothetical protein